MENTITMIKKDAVVSLPIGSGFIKKLHDLLISIVSEHDSNQMQAYTKIVNEGSTSFPETWMETVFILSSLIHSVEAAAKSSGLTYEVDPSTLQDN